jgi:drug/metabolite transporter (DMT)-like permease
MRKERLDVAGVAMLVGVQGLLAVNQVIIKLVNEGLQPVFFAGLRSVLAVGFVWAWLVWRGRPPHLKREVLGTGLLIGALFAAEFLFLFLALDLTSVGRSALIMYSMPVWYAFLAHFGLGERITPVKAAGLALAFAGCAVAILSRPETGEASLIGDLCALGAAWGWAGDAAFLDGSGLGPDSDDRCAVFRAAHPRSAAPAHRWSDLSGLGRGGGRLHRLALADVGLSFVDRGFVLVSVADPGAASRGADL